MVQDERDTERKVMLILKVLSESAEPLGSTIIARELESHGVHLSERAVRYHLRITDERGFPRPLGRDGRAITAEGLAELRSALVPEQVGFVIERIELLAFQTTFDPGRRTGQVPINTSLFPKDRFREALEAMLEMRNSRPRRFVAVITYAGSSLDPSEAYIRARMTQVRQAASTGNGKILANFREIPAPARPLVESITGELRQAGIGGTLLMGEASEPVCQIPVGLNKVGMVLLGGMNPVAAAEEAGIEADNFSETGTIGFERLVSFWEL